jgi:hypothetical protein
MTNKTPEAILKLWMDAVNTGDIATLLDLYDTDAILIPTFSNRILKKPEDRREYFERLATRDDLSVALHEKTKVEQLVNGSIATLSGIYCWRFAIDGQLLNFEARFSYVFDLTRASPIIHHHSSQIPRML